MLLCYICALVANRAHISRVWLGLVKDTERHASAKGRGLGIQVADVQRVIVQKDKQAHALHRLAENQDHTGPLVRSMENTR
eukprot:jgi/Antlo1/452/1782